MTVRELMELLHNVSDKDKPVTLADGAEIIIMYEDTNDVILSDIDPSDPVWDDEKG